MAKHGCILRQSPAGWQIAAATRTPSSWHSIPNSEPRGTGAESAATIARSVAEFVRKNGLSAKVAIAVDSTSAMAAQMSITDPAELRDRRSMGYKTEELLPVAAEDFVADYLPHGQNALAVAVATNELLPIVGALEAAGLKVQSISPAALLALQSHMEGSKTASKIDSDLIVWQNGSAVELFRMAPGTSERNGYGICQWRHLPESDPSTVAREIATNFIRHGSRPDSDQAMKVLFVDTDPTIRTAVTSLIRNEVRVVDSLSFDEHARQGAVTALTGKSRPWIELRRGALVAGDPHRAIRKEWQWCLWATAALLLATATFFWMRSFQYERHARDVQQQQEDLYRQVFPGTRVPSAVVSRLRSEHAKLIGARGQEAAVQLPPSALNVLHNLVNGMPDEVRWQAEQIRIEDGQVDVDLNVLSVGKAGALADALQKHGFDVEPPTTEQNDSDAVAVRIHGRLNTNTSERQTP